MTGFPTSVAEVTPEWLGSVTGWAVRDVSLEEIGSGIGISSAVYRATLRSDDGPPSVIVKLTAADEAAAFTCTVLSMYRREVAFFRELGPSAPIRTPVGHHGAVSDDGSQVVLVMEDLGDQRICDQVSGMDIADAERAVDALALWHARWWGDVDGLTDNGAAIRLSDPLYPAILPTLFDEGWAKATASEHVVVPDALAEIGPAFGEHIADLMEQLDRSPVTLLHGDFRADNILFEPDGSPVLVDFQLTGIGSAAYDLAYFVTQSLDPVVAGAHETALFARWADGLGAAGVPAGDLDGLWEDYRRAALFCLVYPVVACRGMDLGVPREQALAAGMLDRVARAAADLDLADLL